MPCAQAYRHCSQIDIAGLKDPRLHEQTIISALYNLGRLLDDDGRHQVLLTYLLTHSYTSWRPPPASPHLAQPSLSICWKFPPSDCSVAIATPLLDSRAIAATAAAGYVTALCGIWKLHAHGTRESHFFSTKTPTWAYENYGGHAPNLFQIHWKLWSVSENREPNGFEDVCMYVCMYVCTIAYQ